ncbi:MAG: acetyl/propionyl/methylcrotonyl-CoA carboxylase subunit alpha [Alphaproteobacteria bacterium]|nr:acetyl/propionyl/methylcrotonyl-CoA carboxylase subunit alpha [Alphaproteobacteria bacterium]
MFDKVLIANRGEIACRIIRTARRLGIAAVGVYSQADRNALHVALADEAWPIGPAPARDSYLNIDAVIDAAQASGAQAVHPGYGFLSENPEFAEACEQAGLVFIGPPATAIRAMGSKAAAKTLMERAGVPVVPGYHGSDQDLDHLAEEARRIGFPVLIKASAGGGGRGMRIVGAASQFAGALASAQREAASAFGDDRVLLEKYLERPRHVEVQVFADRHGSTLHIFDRDCSIQRRHQKVIEEAPAPGLDPECRRAMGKAAVAAARAIGYVGAGTVEFIVPSGSSDTFYFIEMNTRLQVEHAVTEVITGLDLVEWQLRAATGEKLPLGQHELRIHGHAIEARLYAEDPERDFLPQTGTLHRLHLPLPDIARVDTGVREGDSVTPFYDPMIAKIIVWGDDRAAAVARLRRALAESAVLGLRTNLSFLGRVVADREFRAGTVDTGFIDRRHETLFGGSRAAPNEAVAAAALHRLSVREAGAAASATDSVDPFSPWARSNGWRLGDRAGQTVVFRCGNKDAAVSAIARDYEWLLEFRGRQAIAALRQQSDGLCQLTLDGVKRFMRVLDHGTEHGTETVVFIDSEGWTFEEIDPLMPPAAEDPSAGKLTAPMPGRVTRLLVEPGSKVRRGEPLIVVEAMKMEHTIAAPTDGVVAAVRFRVGELVEEGTELIALAAPVTDPK